MVRRNIGETDTDFLLILPFSDESLGVASSEGGVGEAGSFFAREGAIEERKAGDESGGEVE